MDEESGSNVDDLLHKVYKVESHKVHKVSLRAPIRLYRLFLTSA